MIDDASRAIESVSSSGGSFEVRSGDSEGARAETTVHCSGGLAPGSELQRIDHAWARECGMEEGDEAHLDSFDSIEPQFPHLRAAKLDFITCLAQV